MKFETREFIPVILGGDINTYSVARAFYEEYQVKTHVFGKFPTGPSYHSKIVDYHVTPKIGDESFFLDTMNKFADDHKDKTIILMGAGDNYVALASKYKNELPSNVIVPYTEFNLMDQLQSKEYFYSLCEKHGIDYPLTLIHTKDMGTDFEMNFNYPVILKASNSSRWWEAPFDGQEKVHTVKNREDLNNLITKIYDAGYKDTLVIQDMIPGNDEYMRVLTCYSNKDGEVKMMCLGHTLLEEHTPSGRGNHALVITEPNEEIMTKVKSLLEDLGYVGYSNFDIKYDERDGKYKFFEINTRQGRSNFYVTGSGFNVAKYIVEEYIYGKNMDFEIATEPHLWTVVPKKVAFKYVLSEDSKEQMRQLYKEGKVVNPVFMKGDLSPKRLYGLMKTYFSHFVKFKKYYKDSKC